MRVVIRQLVKKQKKDEKDDDEDDDYFEIHAMKFYLFNERERVFEIQYESIYDVSNGYLES
jgi:hypothetical protein